MKLNLVIPNNKSHPQTNNGIYDGQHKFYTQYVSHVFGEQMAVTGNIPIVVIGNAHVEKNIQRKGKGKQGIIKTVIVTGYNLNSPVDTKQPEGFDQNIDRK